MDWGGGEEREDARREEDRGGAAKAIDGMKGLKGADSRSEVTPGRVLIRGQAEQRPSTALSETSRGWEDERSERGVM